MSLRSLSLAVAALALLAVAGSLALSPLNERSVAQQPCPAPLSPTVAAGAAERQPR